MGQHSGAKHAGATGLQRGPMTIAEVEKAFRDGDDLDVRDLALPHQLTAMNTLVTTCKAHKANHSARVSAAKTILEFAGGKAAQQPEVEPQSSGLTVIVHNLFAAGPKQEKVVIDAKPVEVEEAQVVDAVVEIPEIIERVIEAVSEIPIMLEPKP